MSTRIDDQTTRLSETQLRVINLLTGDRTNSEIASELGLSAATVKWHVSQVLMKLGLASRTEAAEWWRERHGVRRRLWRDAPPAAEGIGDMGESIINAAGFDRSVGVAGETLGIEEWQGSAPGEMHVHHQHDISWHVIEGSLHFRLADREINLGAGETLFVPAGTQHTYGEGDARYLVIAPPSLFALFRQLRSARSGRPHTDWGAGPDAEIYAAYASELLEFPPG